MEISIYTAIGITIMCSCLTPIAMYICLFRESMPVSVEPMADHVTQPVVEPVLQFISVINDDAIQESQKTDDPL